MFALVIRRHAVFRSYGSVSAGYLATGKASSTGAAIKRFWRDVEVDGQASDGGYQIKLDGRPLRTPDGHLLTCPSKMLSVLIASEWQNIPVTSSSSKSDDKSSNSGKRGFPITALVARSVDAFSTPNTPSSDASSNNSSERELIVSGLMNASSNNSSERELIVSGLMRYLDTDTITQFHDRPETMVRMQEEKWLPLIQWASDRFKVDIKPSLTEDGGGLFNTQQSDETRRTLEQYITAHYDNLTLIGFEKAVMYSKSFLIALALFERHIDVTQAVEAARLEYLAQSVAWGRVEDVHDLDEADLERHLGCAASVLLAKSK